MMIKASITRRFVLWFSGMIFLVLFLFVVLTLLLDPSRLFSWKNNLTQNVSIQFYGRAVDATGQGVANAKVTFRLDQANCWSIFDGKNTVSLQPTTATDREGNFALAAKGKSLYVLSVESPELLGHYSQSLRDPINQGFQFESKIYQSDRDKPAIFPMIIRGTKATTQGSRGGKYAAN